MSMLKSLQGFWQNEPEPPIPWRVYLWKHRVWRFIWQLVSITASTALVYGWQPFSAMLLASGVYESLCESDGPRTRIKAQGEPHPVCDAQDARIQSLYSINMASEFALGTLAGIALDRYGPFITGIIGQLTLLVAATCLVLAGEWEVLYLIATALFGASANFIVFPAIASADYFPSRKGLAASLTIACQQGSSGISTLLDMIFRANDFSLRFEFTGYLIFVLIPLAVMYCLATPLIRPALDQRYVKRAKSMDSHNLRQSAQHREQSNREIRDDICAAETEFPHSSSYTEERASRSGFRTDERSSTNDFHMKVSSSVPASASSMPTSASSMPTSASSMPTSAPSALASASSVLIREPAHGPSPPWKDSMPKRSLRDGLVTPELFFIALFVMIVILLFNYYPIILRELSGDVIARFNGYIMPTQAIWGILFGCIVDRTGTLPLCYVLLLLAGFVYLFCLINSFSLQYLTTILFVIGSSFCFTVKFTYIQEIFHPRHHGVLLAILSLLSGGTMLINIALRRIPYPTFVIYGMLGGVIVAGVVVGILHWRFQRGIRYFDPVDPSRRTCSAIAEPLDTPSRQTSV